MPRLSQPVTQVRFTNVAIVRYKRAGIKFEIACYKNKILNYRDGVEKDITEVLQSNEVFTNTQKGVKAKKEELKMAFNTVDIMECCKIILEKGEYQISDMEREVVIEDLTSKIASTICEMCYNPETNTQYTVNMIKNAMKSVNFKVLIDKSPKQQALKCIGLLAQKIPIKKYKMKINIYIPSTNTTFQSLVIDHFKIPILNKLIVNASKSNAEIESNKNNTNSTTSSGEEKKTIIYTCVIEPSQFRPIELYLEDNMYRNAEILERTVMDVQSTTNTAIKEETLPPPPPSTSTTTTIEDTTAKDNIMPPLPSASIKPKLQHPHPHQQQQQQQAEDIRPSGKFICKSCNVGFENKDKHREHFKTDFHRYNLKRKTKGLEPVDEKEFESIEKADLESFFHELY